MATAKQMFLERIANLRLSLDVDGVQDRPATEIVHNNIAKTLRNGLAVVGFVALEDFIKNRTTEILGQIPATGLSFTDLPDKLRYNATVDALSALVRMAKFEDSKEDRIALIQAQTFKIASTQQPAYEFSEYTYGHLGSNISSDEIKAILSAFKVTDGWEEMSLISSRAGLTSFPLLNSFKNATARRNQAAHTANINIPINDLRQYLIEAVGIAFGFDSLVTKALAYMNVRDANYLNGNLTIDSIKVVLGFIRLESGKWKFKLETGRSRRNDTNKTVVESFAVAECNTSKKSLLVFDENGNIVDWRCN